MFMKVSWVFFFCTAMLLFNHVAQCQSVESTSITPQPKSNVGREDLLLRNVTRKPGIDFSFINRLTSITKETRENVTLDGVEVEITNNAYEATHLQYFQTYLLKADNTLEIIETPCAPYLVAAFKVAGTERVFAYNMACKFVKVEAGGFIRDELSGYLRSLYIDENGDGKMETQDYRRNMPERVPEWAKRKIKN